MKSRSQKAILNTFSELSFEFVVALCSFILPRLVLTHFGSDYNGIILSISQFIGCIALLKAGIGGVTRAALFKPLAENDYVGISEVVNATQGFMRKIAIIFSVAAIVFACVYPFLVEEDFNWFFAFSLVLILSIDTFAQYYFGLPYQMVLQADQKTYVTSLLNIGCTIANTIIAAILIINGFGIHIVKLASALVFLVPPIYYAIWVKKKYHIDSRVKPNYDLISQRWDAFGHQLANFINTNTDIIIATILLGLKEVSVYSIYFMVGHAVKKILLAACSGTTAAFGNMLAKNEQENLRKRFSQYELMIFVFSTFFITACSVLITPFVSVYTNGVEDVNYIRPLFGYLVCLSLFVSTIKQPYEQLVYAAGEFKKTRNGAFVEAFLHVALSILLAFFIGLEGLVLGSILAIIYRIGRYYIFLDRTILHRGFMPLFKRVIFSIIVSFASVVLFTYAIPQIMDGYVVWTLTAVVASIAIMFLTIIMAICIFGTEAKDTFKFIVGILRKKNSKKTL